MDSRGILIIIITIINVNPLPSTLKTRTLNTRGLTIDSIIINEVRGSSNGGLGWVKEMKEGIAMVAKPQLIATNDFKKFHVDASGEVNTAWGAQDR